MKFLLLEGFSVSELENQLSPIIKRTYSIRKSLKPDLQNIIFSEIRGTPDKPTFVFLSEPTFNFRMPIVSFGKANREINSVAYETLIQLSDFNKWRKNKYLWQMDIKEFREILEVSDIKVDCQCMAFHWTGIRYQLSQIDATIFPTSIPDKVWRHRHGESGTPTICKHLKGLFQILRFHAPQILSAIKKKYSDPKRVKSIKPITNQS